MLVVIDVGNTNITLGVYDQDELIANFRLTTKLQRTSDEWTVPGNESLRRIYFPAG